MKINFVEKNFKIAERFKNVITEKLEKLSKYFDDEMQVTVACSKQNKNEKLEVTIVSKGFLFRSEVSGENMYNNIDNALPKLEKQIIRHHGKTRDMKKRVMKTDFEFIEEMPETKLPDVFKKKVFDLEPILLDDAKDAIERLGHTFFIFFNAETGKINVLYRRNDGKYGLIEVNY